MRRDCSEQAIVAPVIELPLRLHDRVEGLATILSQVCWKHSEIDAHARGVRGVVDSVVLTPVALHKGLVG